MLIEPLDEYKTTFLTGYSEMLSSITTSTDLLTTSRVTLEELKQKYFKASVKAEKAAKMARIEEEDDRINLACRNHDYMKSFMIKASEDYLNALGHEKKL